MRVYRCVNVGQALLLGSARKVEADYPFIGCRASQALTWALKHTNPVKCKLDTPRIALLHHNAMRPTTHRSIVARDDSERLKWVQMGPGGNYMTPQRLPWAHLGHGAWGRHRYILTAYHPPSNSL
jgi:hypothetical protein